MKQLTLAEYIEDDATFWATVMSEDLLDRDTEGWFDYILGTASREGCIISDELTVNYTRLIERYLKL